MRKTDTRRRGSVLILTAVLMVVMIGMLAFAVDLGYIVHARTQLQRTADACALAAAGRLPDQSAATLLARSVAAENGWLSLMETSDGDELHGSDLDPMKVECGFWDRDTATFTTPQPYGSQANAVRVTLRKTEAVGNPLGLFFARIFGQSTANASASATALYDRWLCGPFVGIESVDVGGDIVTDSYNSGGTLLYQPSMARDRGSVCSDGPATIHGGPIVRGDARAGKGQPIRVDGTSVVTGSIGNRLEPLNLPPVDASEAAAMNDNDSAPPVWQGTAWRDPLRANGDFSLNAGEVYDLPPGTYYLRNVILNGGSTLNISGLTKIYISGTLKRAGGCTVNNSTKIAANLEIYSTGGTIDVTSDNPFYGVIYAPHSRVTVNASSDLFGAIVGRTLKISGTAGGHYDEALELDDVEFSRRVALVD